MRVLNSFLGALRVGQLARSKKLTRNVFDGNGAADPCIQGVSALARACTPEPPYLLRNDTIRVAWVCNGLVSYNSFFLVTDGYIWDVDGIEATKPIVVLPPSRGVY